MTYDDVIYLIVKLFLLLFAAPFLAGVVLAAARRASGYRHARWPGWIYYVGIEIAVLVDKGFPLLWSNLAIMIPMNTPHIAIVILIGVGGGALTFLVSGRTSLDGFVITARLLGFRHELPDRAAGKKKAKPDAEEADAPESARRKPSRKKRKRR